MHIAICDDNVADRKQLERLLGRESNQRKTTTGVFYTDSYGDCVVLGKNPMPYDLFFIDLTASNPDGLTFAISMRKFGVTAPIILCSSSIDYVSAISQLPESPYDFMHISKPINTTELTAILDQAVLMLANRVPTIELRSDKETHYVQEDDIVYAVTEGQYVRVFLNDGIDILILTDMKNFYYGIEMYSHMVLLTDRALINIVHMENYTPFKVVLKNGVSLLSSPFSAKYIKSALQMYHAEAL